MQAILAFKPDQEWGSFLLENPFQLLTNFDRRRWDEPSQFAFGRRCTVGHIQQNGFTLVNLSKWGSEYWELKNLKHSKFQLFSV